MPNDKSNSAKKKILKIKNNVQCPFKALSFPIVLLRVPNFHATSSKGSKFSLIIPHQGPIRFPHHVIKVMTYFQSRRQEDPVYVIVSSGMIRGPSHQFP